MNLALLSGPIIGAVIGYGTNWIAIKMLFRPLKPVKIGKFTLPFTPGIIPKRKDKLAKAIGESVGNNLFTTKDMQNMLLTREIEDVVVSSILDELKKENTIQDIVLNMMSEERYIHYREILKTAFTGKIKNGLLHAQIGNIIAKEGSKIARNKVKTSMLRMFITDGLIDSIVQPMGIEIEKYIEEHGQEKIMPMIEDEIASLEKSRIQDLTTYLELGDGQLENIIRKAYEHFVLNYASGWIEKLDISSTVEEKVNTMEVLELEKIIMSIMKKELGAIVNLGALIGLILGTINIIL